MSHAFDARALEKIDSPEATAAAYFSHLRSPMATPEDYLAFDSWFARDERNRAAWAKVERAWEGAGRAADDPRIAAFREHARTSSRPAPLWRRPMPALAAVLALVAIVSAPFMYRIATDRQPAASSALAGHTIAAGIGQQASFHMTDGSVVTVNTASKVVVAESELRRLARLDYGEAFFEVAKNARKPFVVEVGKVSVTALGTAFSVRNLDGAIHVALAEGRVRVDVPGKDSAAKSVILEPGTSLSFARGVLSESKSDVTRMLAWRQGMLSFDRTPLAEAVAEINRYTQQEIAIVSPEIAERRISGSFRIGITRGFLQSLEAAGIAHVRSETPARVELAAP
ncbi:FecR family protein [Sphingobium lignivorans]|uniref:Transmembrane sensor n=1 Tax=Sphingobium lignivorans TaxID=2735886 RepID=A0ABR6NHJ3_9SPHN|nr:FecR domain-containing protein [Sphingobium lignivorans]MBB5986744.1 transmembrane sensor [Sphingobium lignivorans]